MCELFLEYACAWLSAHVRPDYAVQNGSEKAAGSRSHRAFGFGEPSAIVLERIRLRDGLQVA